jgi:hypothetical protein
VNPADGSVWVGSVQTGTLYKYSSLGTLTLTVPMPALSFTSASQAIENIRVNPTDGSLWILAGAALGPAIEIAHLDSQGNQELFKTYEFDHFGGIVPAAVNPLDGSLEVLLPQDTRTNVNFSQLESFNQDGSVKFGFVGNGNAFGGLDVNWLTGESWVGENFDASNNDNTLFKLSSQGTPSIHRSDYGAIQNISVGGMLAGPLFDFVPNAFGGPVCPGPRQ